MSSIVYSNVVDDRCHLLTLIIIRLYLSIYTQYLLFNIFIFFRNSPVKWRNKLFIILKFLPNLFLTSSRIRILRRLFNNSCLKNSYFPPTMFFRSFSYNSHCTKLLFFVCKVFFRVLIRTLWIILITISENQAFSLFFPL